MVASSTMIAVGGGGEGGHGLELDAELSRGSSYATTTFGNPPLVEGNDFDCVRLEAWVFQMHLEK